MAAPRKAALPPTADQTAFLEDAMQKYGKAVYNYAYRLTGNDADARDLTQDAFIRVYRAWQSFVPGTSFISWVYRIVTNLHRDELRKRKGRYLEELPDDNARQEFGGSRPLAVTPIDDLVDAQVGPGLSIALEGLSPEQRQVILLADVEGMSYQEIADIADCSIGTIRSRLHRARAHLRTLFLRTRERS